MKKLSRKKIHKTIDRRYAQIILGTVTYVQSLPWRKRVAFALKLVFKRPVFDIPRG